jgi:formate C-acetyltransferase
MRGGDYRINLLPTTVHIYFGRKTGATPDGRRSGEPLSEGISPVQGADRQGPTAVLKLASKIDHLRTGGTLLNQKFTPQLLADEQDQSTGQPVRAYFGWTVTMCNSMVDAVPARPRNIQKNTAIDRAAGQKDYFVDIGPSAGRDHRRTEDLKFINPLRTNFSS